MNSRQLFLIVILGMVSTLSPLISSESVVAQQVICDASGRCFVSRIVCSPYGCQRVWQRYSSYGPNRSICDSYYPGST